MEEAKTETKAAEPMVTVEFRGEAYSGREVKRAIPGKSYEIPESKAKGLVRDFPSDWVILEKKTKKPEPAEAPAEAKPVKKPAEPFKPKEKERKLPELKTPGVKKTAGQAPQPQEPAPTMPMPQSPTLKKEGKKITRKKSAVQK